MDKTENGKALSVNASGDVVLVDIMQGVNASTTNISIIIRNTMTSNVNGKSSSANIINSAIVSSSNNIFQVIINGISSSIANIINSFSQSISGNTLQQILMVFLQHGCDNKNTISYGSGEFYFKC